MRGWRRWLAVPAVVAIVALVCAFTLRRSQTPAVLACRLSEETLPADGFSSAELNIRSANHHELRGLEVDVEDPHRMAVDSVVIDRDAARVSLRAGVLPGRAKVRIVASNFAPHEVTLLTTPDLADSVGDGTPDFLRLHDPADRAAFRRWFTLLAESQYYRDKTVPAEINDCAALLRYAYREALREHNAAWARATALQVPASAVNVQQYQYPYTPFGAALFRVRGGSFTAGDLDDGAFAQFADVETLQRYNTFLIGRDVSRARPGDLLFFRQDGQKMAFHAMIFLGRSQIESANEQYIVYHTGPAGKLPGEIRRWSVAELVSYPEARWRPIPSNPTFLGVYRWNILRGAE